MKGTKILYWVTTIFIFLFEGVMTALTSHTELAREGITHLGYPLYFGIMLSVFKVVGALVLVIPAFKGRFKEWAYAGFGIVFISATVSHAVVDGLQPLSFLPVIAFGVLTLSYLSYHKLHSKK